MDTDNFIAYMNANLLITDELKEATRTMNGLTEGLLASPVVKSDRIEAVDNAVKTWTAELLHKIGYVRTYRFP